MTKDQRGAPGAKPKRGRIPPIRWAPIREIGRKLKQYYDELVSDDVPDRFAQLLSQLEAGRTARRRRTDP